MLPCRLTVHAFALAFLLAQGLSAASAQESHRASAAVKTEDNGKSYDANGNPTFNIERRRHGRLVYYSGYRRYHSDCHVCHGPDGVGSSYAPALADSLKTHELREIPGDRREWPPEVGGARRTSCRHLDQPEHHVPLDDLYIYLRARADGALPRGRPAKEGRQAAGRR